MYTWKNTFTFIIAIIAAGCYIIGIVGAVLTAQQPPETYALSATLACIFLGGGVALNIVVVKRIKEYKHYKKYLDYITAKRKISVEELAKMMQKRTEDVIKDVSAMIQIKMVDGYINEYNEIVLKSYEMIENNIKKQKEIQNMKTVPVKCDSCGAINKYIEGQVNRCEYCNSYLKKK